MPVRTRSLALAAAVVTIALVAVGFAPSVSSAPGDAPADVSKLDFLAGSWKGKAWGGDFHAYYSTPEGGKVLSSSELYQEGKIVFFEFEKFEVLDGKVRLRPFPAGQPAASFTLDSLDAKKKSAVFVNPENDYPKRIEYTRAAKDRLVITLSNPDGKTETFDLKTATTEAKDKDAKKR